MKTIPPRIAGLVFFASALSSLPTSLRAQDDGPPGPIVSRALAATVDYGNEAVFQPAKQSTDFERLGVLPNQVLSITVQFPVELAGQTIIAEALDGGTLSLPEGGLVVGRDGTVSFQFQAGISFGACRIGVHQPDDSNFIQLWIVDPDHPENTPPGLPGSY
ncbi:MAG TPA: hypothetical protein VGI60_03050 [Chthoniobacterales bacterium]|jgi:hypothetical protein